MTGIIEDQTNTSPITDGDSDDSEDNLRTATIVPSSRDRRFRSRNEFARTRDVHRYLHAWQSSFLQGGEIEDALEDATTKSNARTCPDTALAAFVQLACLRMHCRAAQISLVGEEHEYVLAEATKTSSLQRVAGHNPADFLSLGTSKLPRLNGMAAEGLRQWRKARRVRESAKSDFYYLNGLTQHSLIISDVRSDSHYSGRHIVKYVPWLRFFCAVPLRGPQGSVLGHLAILCDRPRYGVSHEEMLLLEDLADTIVEHLDSVVLRSQRQTSDRHLQGLTLFTIGKKSLREWWMTQDDARLLSKGRHTNKDSSNERVDRADKEFGFATESSSTLSPQHNGDYFGDVNSAAPDTDSSFKTMSTLPAIEAEQNVDPDVLRAELFVRASNLLREALDATGALLVDARHLSDSSKQRNHRYHSQNRHSEQSDTARDATSSDSGADRPSTCDIIGISVRNDVVEKNDDSPAMPFTLSKNALKRLIKLQPRGAVVYFDEAGGVCNSTDDDKSAATSSSADDATTAKVHKPTATHPLRNTAPGARSMMFLPLWDYSSHRWQSCIFVWTTSRERYFDPDLDLLYLTAFGQSIQSGLARVESVGLNMAKDTFISSISHELRSPLHGILAGVELVQESELNGFQDEMVQAIGTTGRLLLDTIEHVLDYSKISTHSRSTQGNKKNTRTMQQSERTVLSAIDLAQLTEDVVDTCVAAHASQTRSTDRNVSVTLNIKQRQDWTVELESGAWIRILTNILGNALKYTRKGYITIELGATYRDVGGSHKLAVHLEVQDSGAGMSKSFLSNGVFTPFKQENPLSSGTGLGLSIVKRLVEGLHGKLTLRSKHNVGTKVSVQMELELSPIQHHQSGLPRIVDQFQIISEPQEEKLASSLLTTAADWLQCDTVSSRELVDISEKSVIAITHNKLTTLMADDPTNILPSICEKNARLLIISSWKDDLLPLLDLSNTGLHLDFLHEPVGPKKLLRILSKQAGTSANGMMQRQLKDKSNSYSADENTSHQLQSNTSSGADNSASKKVLLVEDNAINMKFLTVLMQKLNITYDCAVNGQEAVELYEKSASCYMLILMDMSMPVLDGFGATTEIRKIETKRKLERVRITAVTGVTSEQQRDQAFRCGVDDFYSKPVQMRELQSLLLRVNKSAD